MLNFLLGPPPRRRMDTEGHWIPLGGMGLNRARTRGGVDVDENLALTYSAVWCATRIISETTASLPLFLYRRLPSGDREPATDHYQFDLLKVAPNDQMGSMAFREGRTAHQVNWGQGFAEIEWDKGRIGGTVDNLWPIHPSRVRPTRTNESDRQGRPLLPDFPYIVRNNDSSEIPMRAGEMLHVPGSISEDGIWGKGVIAYARECIGFGLATERHGATMFGSGLLPRGFLSIPGLKDRESRQQFRQEWRDIHGNPDAADIGILPVDAKFYHLSMSHEDSQFLGTRQHNVTEIARWYRLPPHMLADLSRATFSNIEHQSLEFVVYSLMPWLTRWEEQLALKLLTRAEREEYYFEHNVAGLLRGDIAARYAAYVLGVSNGFLTINEVRRLENLPGIGPAGDQHFVQLAMSSAENMLAGIVPGMKASPTPKKAAALSDKTGPDAATPATAAPELLDLPDFRQPDNWSCGAAVTQSVCAFFGVGPATHDEYVGALGTTPADGTAVIAIVDFLFDQGLKVSAGDKFTVEDLRRFFLQGQPVICPVQMYGAPAEERAGRSGHYVAVIGVGLGQVFVQDPSAGRRLMSEDEFLADWFDRGADGDVYEQFGIAVGDVLAGGKDDGPDDPEEPGGGDTEEPGPGAADAASGAPGAAGTQATASQPATAAAKAMLMDTLGRMFAKEANAAQRAATTKGKDFDTWLGDFYLRHREVMAKALTPTLMALEAWTGQAQVPAAAVAAELAVESQAILRKAYDTETPAQFQARIAAWPKERAEIVAGRILGPTSEAGHAL